MKKTSGVHRLWIISGPSCVGKSPLYRALKKYYPALTLGLEQIVLYCDRERRPKEKEGVDYYYRPRKTVRALGRQKGFVLLNVRGDLQALDTAELKENLKRTDMLFEGNPFMGAALMKHPALRKLPVTSVFISPLSRAEVLAYKASYPASFLQKTLTRMMREKLMRRTQAQKGRILPKDLSVINRRSRSAYGELKLAQGFGCVIPNHDGEDSGNWTSFGLPVADARRTLEGVAALLRGKKHPVVEHWERGLISK